MMVSPVSFRATTAANFQEMLRRPQTYAEQPAAASTINAGGKKKGGVGKKLLGVLVAAAAVAAGLVLGHNKGWFTNLAKKEGTADFIKKGLGYLDDAGAAVLKYAGIAKDKAIDGFNWVKAKGTGIIDKLKNKPPQAPQG